MCGLILVSSPHLARSYHHLFPVRPFQEVAPEELVGIQVHLRGTALRPLSACVSLYRAPHRLSRKCRSAVTLQQESRQQWCNQHVQRCFALSFLINHMRNYLSTCSLNQPTPPSAGSPSAGQQHAGMWGPGRRPERLSQRIERGLLPRLLPGPGARDRDGRRRRRGAGGGSRRPLPGVQARTVCVIQGQAALA